MFTILFIKGLLCRTILTRVNYKRLAYLIADTEDFNSPEKVKAPGLKGPFSCDASLGELIHRGHYILYKNLFHLER